MKTDSEIIEALTKSIALHAESKDRLVERMMSLLDPLPAGMRLSVGNHTITFAKVFGPCSQWANRAYATVGKTNAYIIDGVMTLGTVDVSFFDGNNHQSQFGDHYLDRDCSDRVKPASAKILREIARELPAALISYAASMADSAVQNDAATANL